MLDRTGVNHRQQSLMKDGSNTYYDQTLTLGCAALALDYKHALGPLLKTAAMGLPQAT